jgi:hypothetical protein
MIKPSKKVISIMIIIFAITVGMIGNDMIKSSRLAKKDQKFEGGLLQPIGKVSSIEEYFIYKLSQQNSTNNQTSRRQPETLTEFALTELFSNYYLLRNQSRDNPQNLNALTTVLARQTTDLATIPNQYSIFQLRTFPDNQKEATKRYGNEFARIAEKYLRQRILLEEDDSMEYIKKYALIQQNMAYELSRINIPRSISDEHLNYINNLHRFGVAIVKLAEVENDPIFSALILKQYDEIRLQNPEIMRSISNYFLNNDIIFDDDEPGVMWDNF